MDPLQKLVNIFEQYGNDLSSLKELIDKIGELTGQTLENNATKVFIDSLLSIPAFDEYDSVFSNFKETIYLDRLNNTQKNRAQIIELEKKVIITLKQSGINDQTLNHSLSAYFKQINGIQRVDNLEKTNKEKLVVSYEYETLLKDYKKYQEMGIIKGFKEVQDIFGNGKEVPLEFPDEKLLNQKNILDAKLNEFQRVKDLIELNPEFSSIKKSYEKTIYKLDEYIENLETELRIINESLSKTDYKEIKEAVINARLEAKEETYEEDKNKENILETKKRELEEEKKKNDPNYIKITTLQKEIERIEEEEIKEVNEETHEDKLVFIKSEDEELLSKAEYINLRNDAKKQIDAENQNLKTQLTMSSYEQMIMERMQKLLEERMISRSIEDIKLNLYKQDRTLNLNEDDLERLEKYQPKKEEIDEYTFVANQYIEKENEIMNMAIKDEEEFLSLLRELELDDDLDLTDYQNMLEELDKDIHLSDDEKQILIDEINERKQSL